MNELKAVISTDWANKKFFIGVNRSDIIEVIFSLDGADIYTINAYMNGLINDERITKFWLRKGVDDWGKKNDDKNTVSYSFKPPWIK